MTTVRKSRRAAMAAFILLYLAVSQSHLHQHLCHSLSAGDGSNLAGLAQTAPAAAGEGIWIGLPGSSCPGDYPAGGQAHQNCTCSMSLFTVQPRYESRLLLAARELSFPPLDQLHSQPFPRGVNPPPRIA